MIEAFAAHGLLAQARAKRVIEIETLNPRRFTTDVHQTVDDRAFGGGDGMVMKYEPLSAATEELRAAGPVEIIVLSPQGARWTQEHARVRAESGRHVAFVCGRYAGIDHRYVVRHADLEVSLGDFVLNGGEVAALALIESIARLRPGVLGNAESSARDSFADDEKLLECPQFTRPRTAGGLPVPSPLLSGNHAEIVAFTRAASLVRTRILRPDLGKGGARGAVSLLSRLADDELVALGLSRDALTQLENS